MITKSAKKSPNSKNEHANNMMKKNKTCEINPFLR